MKYERNKSIKHRVISMLLAMLMMIENAPIQKLFVEENTDTSVIQSMLASAEDSEEDDPDYKHDANNKIKIQLSELVAYSEHCQRYPVYHQNDKIIIQGTTGDTTYFEAGFQGLGTELHPFAGSIEYENNISATLNLDAPLFNYVYDTVTINGGNTFSISRYYDTNRGDISKTTPFLASNIYVTPEKPADAQAVEWHINITKPTWDDDTNIDPMLNQFSGVIGTMETNAVIDLTVDMNQVNETIITDSATKEIHDTEPVPIKGTQNLGFACGTIKSGAKLIFTLTSDENQRQVSEISTISGAVGGLVGKMESGAVFDYHGNNPQSPNEDIKTDNGYAGGIVGENFGGTVKLNEGSLTVHNVTPENAGSPKENPVDNNENLDNADSPGGNPVDGNNGNPENADSPEENPVDGNNENPENADSPEENPVDGNNENLENANSPEEDPVDGNNGNPENADSPEENPVDGNNENLENADSPNETPEEPENTETQSPYSIKQHISGTDGAGGVYGHYVPSENLTVSSDLYDINCQVNGSGCDGGLYGKLETGYPIEITAGTSTISSDHASGEADCYGGLIGRFVTDALENTLSVGAVSVQTSRSGEAEYYGGGVGIIDESVPTYANFDGFTVTQASNTNALTFGGAVASANNAFVDVNNLTVKTSDNYKGGGVVGTLDHGILQLSGQTVLTNAQASTPASGEETKVGQIVGYRDDALIFAKSGWEFYRSSTASAVDDIGAWGEVLRLSDVLTVDETTHKVTIQKPATSYTSIGSQSDFVKTALCFQLNASNNIFLEFEQFSEESGVTNHTWETIKNEDITLTADVSLSGTGITGLTRDNIIGEEEKHIYYGNFSGVEKVTNEQTGEVETKPKSRSLTLAIGENYQASGGSNGTIYRHVYNGLFGVTKTTAGKTAIQNVDFSGAVNVNARKALYIGTAVALASTNFTAQNINVLTTFTCNGDSSATLGRLLGEADSAVTAINISNSTFSGNVTGNNSDDSTCLGGMIGKVSGKAEQNYTTINLSGKIENTSAKSNQRLGGLVAVVTNAGNQAMMLDTVKTNNLEVSGQLTATKDNKDIDSKMGGLLGFSWISTNVNFKSVTIGETTDGETTGCTVTIGNTANYGNGAGLVYQGTGKWTVTDLDVNSITVNSNALVSFGMIVNTGWSGLNGTANYSGGSAIYLLLPTTGCYAVNTANFGESFSSPVYDELVAYSAYYRTEGNTRYNYVKDSTTDDLYVLRNGQGVVSIHTNIASGLVMDSSNSSQSYKAQTSKGNVANPNTRYYYNLDAVTVSKADYDANSKKEDTDESKVTYSPQQKLMSWGLHQYAHKSIEDNFAGVSFDNLDYNMTGYSWYPVDVEGTVNVMGTFTFANEEFESSELKKSTTETPYSFDRTSLDTPAKTQHYLLHAGIFRNVSGTVNIASATTLTLKGNVSNANNGSGALICGTVRGNSANAHAYVNTSGNIELAGIQISGFSSETEEGGVTTTTYADYAPLLINKADSYTDMTISNVSVILVKNQQNQDVSPYPNGMKVASSLIGNFGTSTSDTIKINFSNMKLDARDTADISETGLNTIYHTTKSIFTKATLLNQFSYRSGGTGIYNYEYEKDWNGTTHIGNVTYGLELWDGSDKNTTSKRDQYFGQEHKYLGSEHFTSPKESEATGKYNFNGYLPYVLVEYSEIDKTYQLSVNHSSATLTGCGTYNDPYYISNEDEVKAGNQLKTIEQILNDNNLSNQEINIPLSANGADLSATWHDGTYKHAKFQYKSGGTENGVTYNEGFYLNNTYAQNSSGKKDKYLSVDEVRTYLAGAYYQLGSDIKINNNDDDSITFGGLGNTNIADDSFAVFRGVIDCAGYTITNESGNPLIASSNGSVLKDGHIITSGSISRTGTQKSFAVGTDTPNQAYGAVIGKILGGDNIIDGVTVEFKSATTITLSENYAQLVPVGGYVGVVVNGGLIFRGMDDKEASDIAGLPTGVVSVTVPNGDPVNEDNKRWLYVNPIIGRVINGYAVTESDAYRPYEDGTRTYKGGTTDEIRYWDETNQKEVTTAPENLRGVTMQNGNKHYSIADIKSAWGENSDGKRSLTYQVTEEVKDEEGNTVTQTTDVKYLPDTEKLDFGLTNSVKDKTKPLVPDGQSFFLMSLMVNSGMAKNTLGYNADYLIPRWGQYDDIGSGVSNSSGSDYDTYAKNEYLSNYKVLNSGSTKYGYLAKFYTTDGSLSKDMANQSTILTLNGDCYLPDGYKGIGNMFNSADNYRMKITNFNGNGYTISQNSSYYYYYSKDNDKPISPTNTTANDYKNKVFDTAYPNISEAGFGLFNYQKGSASETNGGYTNFTLTGNVISDCIDSKSTNGSHIPYYANITDPVDTSSGKNYDCGIDRSQMISAGMLIGTSKETQYLNSVAVNNIYVKGVRVAGGLIGHIPDNKKTEYDNTLATASEKIKVHSGGTAGGMIGKSYQGDIYVDNHNATYNITEVVSECDYRSGYDYNYGVGGFLGYGRKTNGQTNYVTIKNVVVGDKNAEKASIVKCNENCIGGINTGGFSGMQNRIALFVDNCKVYNQSVTSPYITGGLLGYIATIVNANIGDEISIKNVEIYSNSKSNAEIETTGNASFKNDKNTIYHVSAGGLIGAIKFDCSVPITLQNCIIDGYDVSAPEIAGGLVGVFGHNPSNNGTSANSTLEIQNVSISNCDVSATKTEDTTNLLCNAGGLVGTQYASTDNKRFIYGYNILVKNINLNGNNKGTITGLRHRDTYSVIKLVGFSRQDDQAQNGMVSDLVGRSINAFTWNSTNKVYTLTNSTSTFGTNGYVIFADYDDTASSEPIKEFSNVVTSGTNVDTMRFKEGSTTEKENYPFVTSSPEWVISGKNAQSEQYLTGDGVQGLVFSASRFKEIQDDIAKTGDDAVAKAYTLAPVISQTAKDKNNNDIPNPNWTEIADNYTTSAAAYSHIKGVSVPNFPLMIVSSANNDDLTRQINNYLGTLTNTTYNFADTSNSAIYETNLYKCTWNNGNQNFDVDTNPTHSNLKMTSSTNNNTTKYTFYMNANNVDTDNTTPIFTLIDVQFKDPSNSGQIAYHLYVPVYVKKLLRYNFRIAPESGTDYLNKGSYSDDRKTLFENTGNPITVGFEYEYQRKADEWKDEINAGTSVLTNYYKTLTLNNQTDNKAWPAGTKFMLVDAAAGGKTYYLNIPPSDLAIDLYDFTDTGDATGVHYSPAPFNNLMIVTVEQPDDDEIIRNLVKLDETDEEEAIEAGATVRDKNNVYYRPYDESKDSALTNDKKYAVTGVTLKNTTATYPVERYYLTILTPKNEADTVIYHYEISSRGNFEKKSDNSDNPKWSVEKWEPNSIDRKQNAHLLLGNLYENVLTLNVVPRKSGTQFMDNNNNWLTVTMTANIKLTDSAKDKGISSNMQNNPDSTIYQTFLMSYDKLDKRVADGGQSQVGVQIAADVSIGSDMTYYIQGGNTFSKETATPIIEPETPVDGEVYASKPEITENYIEFANNQNLLTYLADKDDLYGNAVSLQVKFDAVYQPKLLIYQFPKNDNEDNSIGASVIGYSNIASSKENAAFSATSTTITDGYRYYTKDDSAAELEYNVVQTPEAITGAYSYLGKNAVELESADTKKALSYVDTYSRYDTRALRTDNDYIEYTLTLSNRKTGYVKVETGEPDSTGKSLTISDYLTDLTFYGININQSHDNPLYIFNQSSNNEAVPKMNDETTTLYDTDGKTILARITVTDTLIRLRVHKSQLNTQGDGIYLLPIDFKVKTGDGDFNNNGLAYSNYKVSLTAATYKDGDTAEYFPPSYASNHVIYTNARLEPSIQ